MLRRLTLFLYLKFPINVDNIILWFDVINTQNYPYLYICWEFNNIRYYSK